MDRRAIDKADPLSGSGTAAKFYAEYFEPFFDAVALGNGSEPDYFVLYKSSQPWKKDAIVQLPPFPKSHRIFPVVVATRTEDALELPTDFESYQLSGVVFRDQRAARPLGSSLNVHAAHARFRSRHSDALPFGRASLETPLSHSSSSSSSTTSTPTDTEVESDSSTSLDSEQIAMLHSLSKDDLEEMCSNYALLILRSAEPTLKIAW